METAFAGPILLVPIWMINALDKEARHLGVPRQSLIKIFIARHLEKALA